MSKLTQALTQLAEFVDEFPVAEKFGIHANHNAVDGGTELQLFAHDSEVTSEDIAELVNAVGAPFIKPNDTATYRRAKSALGFDEVTLFLPSKVVTVYDFDEQLERLLDGEVVPA